MGNAPGAVEAVAELPGKAAIDFVVHLRRGEHDRPAAHGENRFSLRTGHSYMCAKHHADPWRKVLHSRGRPCAMSSHRRRGIL